MFERERPSHVCHLAARAGVRASIIDPYIYVHSNIEGNEFMNPSNLFWIIIHFIVFYAVQHCLFSYTALTLSYIYAVYHHSFQQTYPTFAPFLPSFLPTFLPSFYPSFVRSFLRSFVPTFLPSLASHLPSSSDLLFHTRPSPHSISRDLDLFLNIFHLTRSLFLFHLSMPSLLFFSLDPKALLVF